MCGNGRMSGTISDDRGQRRKLKCAEGLGRLCSVLVLLKITFVGRGKNEMNE